MDKIIDRFVLFVFQNPVDDILELFNRFVYSLTPEEKEEINKMVPLVIESGNAAREAPEMIRQLIIQELEKKYNGIVSRQLQGTQERGTLYD